MKEERRAWSPGWVWRLRPDAPDWLRSCLAAIPGLDREAGAELLKETGRRRSIWKWRPASGPLLFIKHYGRPRFWKQLKYLFRNSRTQQEWEVALALEARGFPVVRHWALGEKFRAGLLKEDYLVQDYLPGFRNFDRFWEEELVGKRKRKLRQERNALIAELARLIRRLHDQGVWQRDFKPDSVMVTRIAQGFDLKLVDLERVRLLSRSRGLSLRRRLDNLAKVDQTFGFLGNTADRLRFWRTYWEQPGLPPLPGKEGFARVGALAEDKFRRRAREREIWPVSVNSVYNSFEQGPWRVHYHREIPEEWLRELVAELAASGADLFQSKIQNLKSKITGNPIRLSLRPARGAFRPGWPWGFSGARYGLKLVAHLYYRRVPFVPARAALLRKRGGDFFPGYLVALDPGPPFQTWNQTGPEIAAEVGGFLRVLHRMGLTLGRVQADSFLVDPERPKGRRLYLFRVEDLILGRTPDPDEAERRLGQVVEMLAWPNYATMELRKAYRGASRRWFKEKERW